MVATSNDCGRLASAKIAALTAAGLILTCGFSGAAAAGPQGVRLAPESLRPSSTTAGERWQSGTVAAIDPIRARMDQLSEEEVKQFYLRCSREAMSRQVGAGEIAICSIGYEVLLKRHFAGDFHRLLAWSRNQSDGRVISSEFDR